MQHGKQFEDLLDPRDRVLEHDFHFVIAVDLKNIDNGQTFLESPTYSNIIAKIKGFLVETIANILSASFNYLNSGRLEGKEVKNYAASNIMLNMQSIFYKTVEAVSALGPLRNSAEVLKKVKIDLVEKMERLMKNILINQQDNYPQAPITGGTLKMKNVIS